VDERGATKAEQVADWDEDDSDEEEGYVEAIPASTLTVGADTK
jgi:hypothetical protein